MTTPSPTLRRRSFLKGALGLSAAGVLHLPALAAPKKPVGADHFAFVSDIHIRTKPIRKIQTAKHFGKVSDQILALPKLPTAVIICGDCACLTGKPEDYVLLKKVLEPLRKGGIPIYLILGNHDDRDQLWKAFPEQKTTDGSKFEDPKHIKIISAPSVNLFLLDSKITGDFRYGRLGKDQIAWVDKKLKELPDKPAIFMAHHPSDFKASPLEDYDELCKVFEKHPQAKACFFGHAHRWYQKRGKEEKIWQVCIPSPAYTFGKGEPIGWLDVRFNPKGVNLTLNSLEENHPKQGEVVNLDWQT